MGEHVDKKEANLWLSMNSRILRTRKHKEKPAAHKRAEIAKGSASGAPVLPFWAAGKNINSTPAHLSPDGRQRTPRQPQSGHPTAMMLKDGSKRIPARYRLKIRKSIEAFEQQNREQSQSPPTPIQAQLADISLEDDHSQLADTSPGNQIKKTPARYRLKIRKSSVEAFEQQYREQSLSTPTTPTQQSPTTPTQASLTETLLDDEHSQCADASSTGNRTKKVLEIQTSIAAFEQQDCEESPTTPTQQSLRTPTQQSPSTPTQQSPSTPTPSKAQLANTSLDTYEQANLQLSPLTRYAHPLLQPQLPDTLTADDMSRPPTPSLYVFAARPPRDGVCTDSLSHSSLTGSNVDRMLEFSFIKELVLSTAPSLPPSLLLPALFTTLSLPPLTPHAYLDTGSIVFSHFVDHRLVYKVHNNNSATRTTRYEAVLMGRYRNHAHTIDCFTVLERSSATAHLDRHHALEELLEILENKLLALPGF
ncbi:hypothetical protein IWZ01DRAFT_482409 [Phyllosticta capitalensis]